MERRIFSGQNFLRGPHAPCPSRSSSAGPPPHLYNFFPSAAGLPFFSRSLPICTLPPTPRRTPSAPHAASPPRALPLRTDLRIAVLSRQRHCASVRVAAAASPVDTTPTSNLAPARGHRIPPSWTTPPPSLQPHPCLSTLPLPPTYQALSSTSFPAHAPLSPDATVRRPTDPPPTPPRRRCPLHQSHRRRRLPRMGVPCPQPSSPLRRRCRHTGLLGSSRARSSGDCRSLDCHHKLPNRSSDCLVPCARNRQCTEGSLIPLFPYLLKYVNLMEGRG